MSLPYLIHRIQNPSNTHVKILVWTHKLITRERFLEFNYTLTTTASNAVAATPVASHGVARGKGVGALLEAPDLLQLVRELRAAQRGAEAVGRDGDGAVAVVRAELRHRHLCEVSHEFVNS